MNISFLVFANLFITLLILGLVIILFVNQKSKLKNIYSHLQNNPFFKTEKELRSNKVDFNSENRESKSPEEREEQNRESLSEIILRLGSTPKQQDNNSIGFSYQGENFLVMFNGAFLRIWDLSWLSIKPTDDNFTLLKDAVNYANFTFGPTILMHSPDENGDIMFSSRIDIPYFPSHSDNEGYISAYLDSFFGLKNTLHREINRLRDNPHDRTLHDNPIGFDTASLSDPTSPQAN